MEDKKYELVEDDFIIHEGKKLYRIRALIEFTTFRTYIKVKKGQLGGYVEGYHNLSQEDSCWIFNDSKVYGNAIIKDHARVGGGSKVYGNAIIKDDARISGGSEVYGNAVIKDDAIVNEKTEIYGNAEVKGSALVRSATIADNSSVTNANIAIASVVCDNVDVLGGTTKCYSHLTGNLKITAPLFFQEISETVPS